MDLQNSGVVRQITVPIAFRIAALVMVAGERASFRYFESTAVTIRNMHTRPAYRRAMGEFL